MDGRHAAVPKRKKNTIHLYSRIYRYDHLARAGFKMINYRPLLTYCITRNKKLGKRTLRILPSKQGYVCDIIGDHLLDVKERRVKVLKAEYAHGYKIHNEDDFCVCFYCAR